MKYLFEIIIYPNHKRTNCKNRVHRFRITTRNRLLFNRHSFMKYVNRKSIEIETDKTRFITLTF